MSKLIVLKLSGHLIKHVDVIKQTLSELKSLPRIAEFVLVPGGSVFADFIKELQAKLHFNDNTAHWLAIKAMEMYGTYIASLDESNTLVETYDLSEVQRALNECKIPIIMPYRILQEHDELPHSWNVTSDSIAIYIASLLNANLVVLAKPVSRILGKELGLVRKLSTTDLRRLGVEILDPFAVDLLSKVRIPLVIYNVFNPHVLRHIVIRESGDYVFVEPS